MDDMTHKMVEFSHKTKNHGHFMVKTNVDNIPETDDFQAVSIRSKSLHKTKSNLLQISEMFIFFIYLTTCKCTYT
jgi:hypothetical protein